MCVSRAPLRGWVIIMVAPEVAFVVVYNKILDLAEQALTE